jgi:hypothetical protein
MVKIDSWRLQKSCQCQGKKKTSDRFTDVPRPRFFPRDCRALSGTEDYPASRVRGSFPAEAFDAGEKRTYDPSDSCP